MYKRISSKCAQYQFLNRLLAFTVFSISNPVKDIIQNQLEYPPWKLNIPKIDRMMVEYKKPVILFSLRTTNTFKLSKVILDMNSTLRMVQIRFLYRWTYPKLYNIEHSLSSPLKSQPYFIP